MPRTPKRSPPWHRPHLDEDAIAALPAMHVEDTPGASTIAKLAEFSNRAFPGKGPIAESGEWTRYEMLKHLVYLLTSPTAPPSRW